MVDWPGLVDCAAGVSSALVGSPGQCRLCGGRVARIWSARRAESSARWVCRRALVDSPSSKL